MRRLMDRPLCDCPPDTRGNACNGGSCRRMPEKVRDIGSLAHPPSRVRTFATGADRDMDDHKPDFEGALSPLVLRRFAEYMRAHSIRQDGTRRSSDNWKKGMPQDAYMKSLMRHVIDVWTLHSGHLAIDADGRSVEFEEALCAVLFNVQGLLHERLKVTSKVFAPGEGDEQMPAGPSH